MKIKLLFLFLALTVSTYAQKPAARIFYGFSDAELLENEELDGSPANDIENHYEFGAELSIPLSKKISLIAGLTYSKTTIKIQNVFYYNEINNKSSMPHFRYNDLEILSIPILLEFNFWNYFFLNAGPVLSFELNDPDIEYSQNGIGYHLGFGGQYNVGDFFIFANPYFKQFATIDFKDEMLDYNLSQFGAHIGIGYQF
ncbi:hypothetical protein SAMN04487907_102168 [Zunongwangia mangrovi]|uniref:Outer membrane protein beta-barrel domain-containing protein n=1 Tax=Zunongwangia mangrovi TaxID=1334022 RepID=A0A1I1GFA9_9FLAO|nr:hypothetical protein [Zunongwangia mangrovi]SFC08043.1 hypothetical protein SAMN04487907_102168 [Zunongwangia mangrovi]